LKNRNLFVEGWYSTNILGNSDGLNLQDEAAAKNKLYNKTQFLYDVLGYNDFQHKVVIDYYKPRKDKKESWDVIDIIGILNEKMSIRINFQGNDSILASAMILDLCIIATRLLAKSQGGECPGVDFFFKNNISNRPMTDYNSQFEKLTKLLFELQ